MSKQPEDRLTVEMQRFAELRRQQALIEELTSALRMLADWSDSNVADPALTGPLGYARAALAKAEAQS